MRHFTGHITNDTDVMYPGPIFFGNDNNTLYGVSWDSGGPITNGGAIFKINRDGSGYQVLRRFLGLQTTTPTPTLNSQPGNTGLSLIQGNDGWLYGRVYIGSVQNGTNSSAGEGFIFRCDADGNQLTVLRSFTSPAEQKPLSLIQGADGALYGTCDGDSLFGGVIFTMDTQGGNYRILHEFYAEVNPGEGSSPFGRLLQASDGAFYGTCAFNDTGGLGGTIFKVTTNNQFTLLHTFPAFAGDGLKPVAGLIQGNDGALYVTTVFGGTGGAGTVFKININGSGYQVLHNFAPAGDAGSSDGKNPWGELIQAPANLGGMLIGATTGGTNNHSNGTIFRVNPDGSGYNILFNFPGTNYGTAPFAGLVAGPVGDTNGLFYGTATRGGSANVGTLFSVLLPNPPLSITPVTGQASGGQTVLYWPAWASSYKLQMTTNLSSTNWTTVTNACL